MPTSSRSRPDAIGWAPLRAPEMLALHLLLVFSLVGTGLLGWWQFDAWQSAQADDSQERSQRPAVALPEVLGPDEAPAGDDVGVPVIAEGRYAPAEEQFLVARPPGDRPAGYWVLSPLRIDATGSSLLVVRGWTAQSAPLPPVPAGRVREVGVLQPGEDGSGAVSEQRVVSAVRIPSLVGETDGDLYGAYLLRTEALPGDPARELRLVSPTSAGTSWSAGLRNLAYAAQWWLFGTFAVVLWSRMCADRLATAREQAEAAQVASPT